ALRLGSTRRGGGVHDAGRSDGVGDRANWRRHGRGLNDLWLLKSAARSGPLRKRRDAGARILIGWGWYPCPAGGDDENMTFACKPDTNLQKLTCKHNLSASEGFGRERPTCSRAFPSEHPFAARIKVMSRFPKIVTGAAAGAALFMLGIMAGQAQPAPQGNAAPSATTPSATTSRQVELLGKILDMVQSNYVDKPDDGKLLNSAINGILGGLDPH